MNGLNSFQGFRTKKMMRFFYQKLSVFVNFSHVYLLLQSHWDNSAKLGTKHPCVKGIQVCSNKGPRPFPRGDKYYIAKLHWRNKKNLLFQNYWANFNQTWHKASLGDGNSSLFKWRAMFCFKEDISNKIAKIHLPSLKIFFFKTLG